MGDACARGRWEAAEDERIGLAEVLAEAEDAAPVASLDVVARNLRDRFGARYVSFLFLDVVGRKVVRVTEEAGTQQGRRADRVPPAGSVYEQVLRTQKPIRAGDGGDGQRILAPVTNRATSSASWSCSCPNPPTASWSRPKRPRTRRRTSASPTAVGDAAGGHLQDDATVICLDRYGPRAGGRHAHAGADA